MSREPLWVGVGWRWRWRGGPKRRNKPTFAALLYISPPLNPMLSKCSSLCCSHSCPLEGAAFSFPCPANTHTRAHTHTHTHTHTQRAAWENTHLPSWQSHLTLISLKQCSSRNKVIYGIIQVLTKFYKVWGFTLPRCHLEPNQLPSQGDADRLGPVGPHVLPESCPFSPLPSVGSLT